MNPQVHRLVVVVASQLLLLVLGQIAFAQHVQTKVAKDSVQVAEPFILQVIVTAPAGSKVAFPTLKDRLGPFEIVSSNEVADLPIVGNSTLRTWTRRYELESIETGEQTIPPLDIRVSGGQNATTLRTDPIVVHVASVLEGRADPTIFRDIQGVVDAKIVSPKKWRWAWYAFGGIAAVSLALLLVVAMTRRQSWMTPRAWAIERLTQLRTGLQTGEIEPTDAATDVSRIMKEYVGDQFALDCGSMSSSELMQNLEFKNVLAEDSLTKLEKVLDFNDNIKFAGRQASSDTLRSIIDEAQALVESISHQCELFPESSASHSEAV